MYFAGLVGHNLLRALAFKEKYLAMDLDFLIALSGAVAGVTSIISNFRKPTKKEQLDELEKEIDENIENLSEQIPRSEVEEFKEKVHKASLRSREKGFVDKNFLIYFAPGVIAISLFALYIYLIATNDSSYQAPESLMTLLKLITGFLFGSLAAKQN
ncbi:hypothetical protein [Vibrio sp. ZF57]|uniref:hypothetical protein n=1 Tax=Vibrio sp. ZF57 TaxID=1840084 RepID=UPI0011123642|nr:hypothetical protein [Vibrio sp. ZF57]